MLAKPEERVEVSDPALTAGQEPIADPLAAGDAGGRVIRGGGLRVAGAMTGVVAGAISAPLVVRHLGILGYEHYVTVTSVIVIITALSEGGLANVAVRAFSISDKRGRRSIVASLTGLRIVFGILGAAVAIGFGLLAGYPRIMVVGLALASVGYVFAAVQGSYSVALSATLRLPALAGIDMLRSVASTALLVSLVLLGSGLTGFYLVSAAVQGVALVVTAVLVRRTVPLAPAFNRSRWSELLRETAVYAAAATLGAVYFQIALVSMSILDPGRQTGYFGIAFRIVEIVNGVPWLLAGSVLPVLSVAVADHQRLRYVAGRVFQGAVIAGGWFAICIVLGASFAVHFIAGGRGDPAIGVLRIMGIGVTGTFLVSSCGFVLLAMRMHRALVIANLGALVLALAMSVMLIPLLHADGGAITTAGLELSLASAYCIILARRGITPPWWFLSRFAVAVGVGLVLGAVLLSVSSLLAAVAGSVMYFAILWLLRAIPSELLSAIRWWER